MVLSIFIWLIDGIHISRTIPSQNRPWCNSNKRVQLILQNSWTRASPLDAVGWFYGMSTFVGSFDAEASLFLQALIWFQITNDYNTALR